MWFRRDLRHTDNTALHAALRENDRVIGVFVLDDAILKARDIGAARTAFLFGSLVSLNEEFEKHGGRLILRLGGPPDHELRTLAALTGASALYFNKDYTPYSIDRDMNVMALLEAAGLEVKAYDDALLAPPEGIVDPRDGSPFQTFTPFKRVWETRVRVDARFEHRAAANEVKDWGRAIVSAFAQLERLRTAPDTGHSRRWGGVCTGQSAGVRGSKLAPVCRQPGQHSRRREHISAIGTLEVWHSVRTRLLA